MIIEKELEGIIRKYDDIDEKFNEQLPPDVFNKEYLPLIEKIDKELSDYLNSNNPYISENFNTTKGFLKSDNIHIHFYLDYIQMEYVEGSRLISYHIVENLEFKQIVEFLNNIKFALRYIDENPKERFQAYFE